MASPNGTHETQISGRVVCVNDKGIKFEGASAWLNYSKFAVGIVAPEKHTDVTVTLDKGGFIRAVENGAAGSTAPHGAPGAASGHQRDRTITRLAVLKAAAEYSASKAQSTSADVLKIAAAWERWVNRSDEAPELVDAF